MNMKQAARYTFDEAVHRGIVGVPIEGFSQDHLFGMVMKIQLDSMSEAKMGRWLGWLQAACCIATEGRLSLEDCKSINRRSQ